MRLSHDQYYLQMLTLVAARSTCARRAVGAIITDDSHHILSTGYNGVPSGFTHCIDEPCDGALDESGNNTRCMAVHAEVNAILQCSRLDRACNLYVSCIPCFSCAKMICNTRIEYIVSLVDYPGRGKELLLKAGKEIFIVEQGDIPGGELIIPNLEIGWKD